MLCLRQGAWLSAPKTSFMAYALGVRKLYLLNKVGRRQVVCKTVEREETRNRDNESPVRPQDPMIN